MSGEIYVKKENVMSKKCEMLHEIVAKGKIFNGQSDFTQLPTNGIYVMFEKGEVYCGMNKIVRIGTHRGDNQLRSRMRQHFILENKDRSIFRKNIGRCFINEDNPDYLKIWDYDMTKKSARKVHQNEVNESYEEKIERSITQYISNNISFVVFEIQNKYDRLEYESRLIGTVAKSKDCKPSLGWLGRKSPKAKIRESGLWLVQGLESDELTDQQLKNLERWLID